MTAQEAAEWLGVDEMRANEYLFSCTRVVESSQHIATLVGNQVHLAIRLDGLGGRKVFRECQKTLAEWFELEPVLFAPIRHGNNGAVRMAEALGFFQYAKTDSHLWLVQSKEQFHAKPH